MNAVETLEDVMQERASAHDGADSGAQAQPISHVRIAALKELTLALFKEVEALWEHKKKKTPRDQGPSPQKHSRRDTISLQEEVRRFEYALIRCALIRTGGNQRRAARLLGIKATTLNSKIKRYGIHPELLISNMGDSYFEAQRPPQDQLNHNGQR